MRMVRLRLMVLLVILSAAWLLGACGAQHTGLVKAQQQSYAARQLTLSDALAQLEQLSLPAGADVQSFAGLKASLRQMLERSGVTRFTSAVPSGAAGTVGDLLLSVGGGGDVSLGWTYANRADYDQNSQVNISDLTPLGAHFGKDTTAADWYSKACVADGDGNQVDNISDITPIGASFMATVDGYWVQASLTPAQESSWSDVIQVTFEQSTPGALTPFRRFAHLLAAPVANSYYRVVPYNGAELGPPSNEVQFSMAAPSVTSVSPTTGDTGAQVTFSAVLSGGTPETYTWDFGGGANPDTDATAAPTVTLGAIGVYSASLTVSNAAGSDSYEFTLDVTQVHAPQIDDVQPQTGIEGADVTFTATLSGGAVATYAWDFGGGANPNLSSAASPTVALSAAGSYSASLTVTNVSGSDSFPFTLVSTPNIPPVASFTATPQNGDPSASVILDASASSDPDGGIVKYEWDLDDNGSFELNMGLISNAATTLPSSLGSANVSLRVTDNANATDTASLMLTASSWVIANPDPDSEGNVGYTCSLMVVNGVPAIAYLDLTNFCLKYVRATNAEGSAWGTPQVLDDSAGSPGWNSSQAIVNGNPAMSYGDNNNGYLKYVRATNPDGSAWGAPQIVTPPGMLFGGSLTVVNGNPAVVCQDFFSGDLGYVRATDADGSAWAAPQIVAGNVAIGSGSLEVVNGFPAISYCVAPSGDMIYLRASNADGSAWGAPQTLLPGVGSGGMLAVVNGFPAISYGDATSGDMMYLRASNSDGSAWGAPQILVTGAGTGGSLVLINGIPAINYWDNTNGDLKYLQASDADGSAWGAPRMLLSIGAAGNKASSLALVDGNPAISYYDYVNQDLKFIRLY